MKDGTPSYDDFQALTENLTSKTKNVSKLTTTDFFATKTNTLLHMQNQTARPTRPPISFLGTQPPLRY